MGVPPCTRPRSSIGRANGDGHNPQCSLSRHFHHHPSIQNHSTDRLSPDQPCWGVCGDFSGEPKCGWHRSCWLGLRADRRRKPERLRMTQTPPGLSHWYLQNSQIRNAPRIKEFETQRHRGHREKRSPVDRSDRLKRCHAKARSREGKTETATTDPVLLRGFAPSRDTNLMDSLCPLCLCVSNAFPDLRRLSKLFRYL